MVTMATAVNPFHDVDRMAASVLGSARAPQTMPADVFQSGDHYLVQIDLPGIEPDSLEVTAGDRTLAVTARRQAPLVGDQDGEQQGQQVLVAERRHGRFARQVSLPDGADLDHITADYRDGVLTIMVPLAAQAGARRIAVTHPNGPEQATATATRSAPA